MKNGYYWFTSERASNRSVAQHINGDWFFNWRRKTGYIK